MKKLMALLMASLLMGACTQGDTGTAASTTTTTAASESAVAAQAQQPTYLVAALSTFPPFVFRDEHGQFMGFDVDVLKAIGQKEGFDVTYMVNPWDGIFDTLATDKRHIVSTAVVITPERQQIVDFSDPYFQSSRLALVTDPNLKTFDDLKGKRFVTQSGTSNEPILREYFGDKIDMIGVETQYMEIKELLAGKVDVAFDDSGVMQYYLQQLAEKDKIHGIQHPTYPGDNFGFAVKKGNTELLAKINNGLKTIKQDGTYDAIYVKWFGIKPTDK